MPESERSGGASHDTAKLLCPKVGLLELLLIVAVLALLGQLVGPAMARWWRKPSPGTIGVDSIDIPGLSPDYLIYLPKNFSTAPPPLVVFLHGAGERGNDVNLLYGHGPFAALKNGTALPAVVVAPQCPPENDWNPEALIRFVDHVATTYRIDRQRIYLIGYSMGGYGTWQAAALSPDRFAAAVPIAGGGIADYGNALSTLPVWAFHGSDDSVVSVAESEEMVAAIRDAGGDPKLSILPGAGHNICEAVCENRELWDWLFQQRRSGNRKAPPSQPNP